jgi:hypothetical protein
MKIQYSAAEVIANSRSNECRSWTGGKPGRSAKERLTTGSFIDLDLKPKFKIQRDWPIFTMGSCFAREVENTLVRLGLPVLLNNHGVPAEAYDSWDEEKGTGGGVQRGRLSRGALNKYNTHSMAHEIRRVVLDEKYENEGLIELARDKWFDPHASGLRLAPLEQALKTRATIHAAMAEVKKAKIVFMTLGLTETWLDADTGLAMNVHPGASWLAKMPNRWQFVNYDYTEMLNEMIGLISLIRETCYSDMHFIVTVSPVPLGATAKNTDVVVANSGSKAVLRAVADDLQQRFEFVDYCPSYEYVATSPRNLAWKEDQIHVASPLVKHITSNFANAYYDQCDVIAAE